MTDTVKAARYMAVAKMLEAKAHDHPPMVEMGLRDIAARFRFNAHLAQGESSEDFLKAGYLAMAEVGEIVSVEEMMGVMERRFCMRCLGVEFFGVKMQ